MAISMPGLIHIDVDGLGSAVWVPGVVSQGIGIKPEVTADPTAGSPFPQVVFNRAIRPEFTFTSYCLDIVLGALGLLGLSLKTTGDSTGLTLYLLKTDVDCGRIETGSVHSTLTLTAGCGFVQRITANAGEDATIDTRFIALSSDGVTSEIARADSVALPSAVAETRFTLGPLAVGGVTLDKLTSASVDFGIGAEGTIGDSDIMPTDMMLETAAPVIEGTTRRTLLFGSDSGQIDIGGISGTNSNSALYFRKRKAGSDYFVADETTEHIKLSPTGLFQWTDVAVASGNRPHESSFRITTAQASNGDIPIVISTGSAIT